MGQRSNHYALMLKLSIIIQRDKLRTPIMEINSLNSKTLAKSVENQKMAYTM